MAISHHHLGDNLKPLDELDNYTIEKGDPDPRGSTVVTSDGRRLGEVVDLIVDTTAMKVRYLVVDVEDDAVSMAGERSILLDIHKVEIREDARQIVASSFTGEETAYTPPPAAGRTERDSARLTRSEEELHVGTREVNRGEARVGKHVETERVSQPVTRKREEVVVERRPVEAGARADASTIGEDEVRIPLTEEELVVEKRPVVKEELVVGKRVVEERDTVEADLRREEFDLDNTTTTSGRGPGRGER